MDLVSNTADKKLTDEEYKQLNSSFTNYLVKLKAAGIPTAVYYPKCLHEQPVFAELGYKWGDFPQAEKASREVLSLPMHPFLSEPDQDKVVTALNKVMESEDALATRD